MDKIEIIIGTYDKLILGYKVVSKLNDSYSLEASFTDDSHVGSLKCMYVSPSGTLASSSTDDSVRLHSLIKRKDIGQLFQHDGAVSCIAFYRKSHMFTASEDGTICMWKTRSWEMLRSLKGHKTHVTAVAVHPSGKLGLSVGSDRSLLTWDLVTGKLAFRRKIKEVASNILFTFSGNHYITVFQKRIEIHSLDGTHLVQEIATNWRINEVCLVQDSILAVAGDDRHILLVNVLTGEQILTLDMAKPGEDTFNTRVRCLRTVAFEEQTFVVAATANGNIKMFKVNMSENLADLVLFYEARVRVTCMAAYNFAAGPNIKEEVPELKESKKGKAKAHTQKTVTESDKPSPEVEPDEDEEEEEEVEENEDSDTNIRATARKRKRQPRPQPRNKKRKLQATETDQTRDGNSEEQASTPSRASQRPARQLKKKKKKMKSIPTK